ncbi:MAG: hypothetical protein UX81_C0031G0013, partial [Parcubacteria group bacterium GW2011_GWA2_47_12]
IEIPAFFPELINPRFGISGLIGFGKLFR